MTAPTNGAAGIMPAVLRYYGDFCPGATAAGRRDFLLTAAAIGSCSSRTHRFPAPRSAARARSASPRDGGRRASRPRSAAPTRQIENAAEIGMEHHLGMTCDPVGGLVQIPCIERNAFGAIKAVIAASLALRGDGTHRVSLDEVIETMRQTGADMNTKYKETSLGGLAVNMAQC